MIILLSVYVTHSYKCTALNTEMDLCCLLGRWHFFITVMLSSNIWIESSNGYLKIHHCGYTNPQAAEITQLLATFSSSTLPSVCCIFLNLCCFSIYIFLSLFFFEHFLTEMFCLLVFYVYNCNNSISESLKVAQPPVPSFSGNTFVSSAMSKPCRAKTAPNWTFTS